VQHRKELEAEIQAILEKQTTDYWLKKLGNGGFPIGPINSIKKTFEHPQVIHRQMIAEVDHPTVGKIKTVGIPVKYSETQPRIRFPPPVLGQHTEQVLKTHLGYSTEKIAQLRKQGAI